MFENLTVWAIVISAAWLGLIGYYMYLSQQQNDLERELEALKELLEKKEQQNG